MQKQKRLPGRPPIPEEDRLTDRVTVYFTPTQFAWLVREAERRRKPLAVLVRERALRGYHGKK